MVIALARGPGCRTTEPPGPGARDTPSSGHVPASPSARLLALNAELLRQDSATSALEHWCRRHGVTGVHARVSARLVARRAGIVPEDDRRRRLAIGPTEPTCYRRVRLCCNGRVLSEAENRYIPGRLTPAMNRLLEETDIPFGRIIQPLRFRRRILAVVLLWQPPMEDRTAATLKAADIPPYVLRHHALLVSPDGVPLSEVVETYTRAALFLPELRG